MRKCTFFTVALAAALGVPLALGFAQPSAAQDANAASPTDERIKLYVTGTNIPRIEQEGALPLQIITREEIERVNIQTAAQLANTISAVTSYGSFNETQAPAGSLTPGFAGAGLRGLNLNRTLVLLNGRRLANYAFAGNAVDLNIIPIAAIEKVEILLDGASAIYGSDAIGGVINFITRRDFRGAEATAQYSVPEQSGGWSDRFSLTLGYGNPEKRLNATATIDYQEFGGLPARDRSFSKSFYIPNALDLTSGSSFPANVIISGVSRNPTGDPADGYRNPSCAPPVSFVTSSPFSCRLDPAHFIYDIAPSKRLAAVGSANVQIADDLQLFVDVLYARNTFTFLGSPTSVPNRAYLLPSSPFYPHAFAKFFGVEGQPLNTAWRSYELGPRTDEPIVEQSNAVGGIRGAWSGWRYESALSFGQNRVDDRYTGGYLLSSVINPLLDSGRINPFGLNAPEIVDRMATAVVHGTVRTGTSTMSAMDFRAWKDVLQTLAGPVSLAVGSELRRWTLRERSSEALETGNIIQTGAVPSMDASRTIFAVFGEVSVPIVKTLEANLAVRYDHYSDVGGTTNPKLSLRWQPAAGILVRASAGTGFKAPGLEALYQPPIKGFTNLTSDPARCPTTKSASDCNRIFPIQVGGNPALESEKSSQWGVGIAWSPVAGAHLGVDYFDVILDNLTFAFNPQTALDLCRDGVNGPTCAFVLRGPADAAFPDLPGPIQNINSSLFNLGKLRTSGVDVNAEYQWPPSPWGRFKLGLQATYTIKLLQQQIDGSYVDRVNHYLVSGGFGAVPYWHHYLTLDWSYGAWTVTLTQNFQTGTYDQNPDPGQTQLRRIGNYDIWNVSGSYVLRDWLFAAGIKNLTNRDPPFTNQTVTANAGGPAGYDASAADPRGRVYWASVRYRFR